MPKAIEIISQSASLSKSQLLMNPIKDIRQDCCVDGPSRRTTPQCGTPAIRMESQPRHESRTVADHQRVSEKELE
jgi:hypothetical protein